MFPFRAFRRLFSAIALLAIVGGALAPSLSHLLYASGGKRYSEICTAQGIRLVATEGQTPDQQGDIKDRLVLKQCPFCTTHAGSFGLPPVADLVFRLPEDGSQFYPPLYLAASRPLFAWATAQPRAPPALSA